MNASILTRANAAAAGPEPAAAAPRPIIRCEDVSKSYGAHKVIEGLSLSIHPGEFVSLLGPSGSGKTTLLMMIAGFEQTSGGAIWADDRRIDMLPPFRRDMGLVFQNYALFPHMTVAQNIGFPLKMRRRPRAEIAARVGRALEMIQLESLAGRYPSQLSGGQQQRVALARALVFEPRVVLMDEPLGALDKRLREQMQLDIREIHHRLGLTIVFVTHDQSEALVMSDRIAVFDRGRIEQVGTPAEIYDTPHSRFVAEFIGETNLFTGRLRPDSGDRPILHLGDGQKLCVSGSLPAGPGEVAVSVRPERIRVVAPGAPAAPTENRLAALVQDIVYLGDHIRLQTTAAGVPVVVRLERSDAIPPQGTTVTLAFDAAHAWALPR